jgi:hypothetical protein
MLDEADTGLLRPQVAHSFTCRVARFLGFGSATAWKLAMLVYDVLKGDFVYRDPGCEAYDTQQRVRTRLRQCAE